MGQPRFLAENLFDQTQFPSATVSANEQTDGREAFRVATRRRHRLNFWTPTTDNSSAWLKVDLGSGNSEAADMIVVDRGHNLDGEQLTLEHSSDDSTWTQVFQITLPTAEGDNTALTNAAGVKTEEGAWAFKFTSATDRYWRLTIAAMGSGNKPEVRGLYLGESYQPNLLTSLPFGHGNRALQYQEIRGATVWSASSRTSERYERAVNLKMQSWSEYHDTARYHIEQLFLRGSPMWAVLDDDYAERMWLARAAPGTTGFEQRRGWGFPQVDLQLAEHQPDLL